MLVSSLPFFEQRAKQLCLHGCLTLSMVFLEKSSGKQIFPRCRMKED